MPGFQTSVMALATLSVGHLQFKNGVFMKMEKKFLELGKKVKKNMAAG